jgi:hypothetical protein
VLTVLKQRVLDYVQRARRTPTSASDPQNLDALEKSVWNSVDGDFAATHAPIAERDWEAGDVLLGSIVQTQRIVMPFPYAVEVVGLNPVIVPLSTGPQGAIAPILDSIAVQIDINSEQTMSSAAGNFGPTAAAPQAVKDGSFVSLSSIGVAATTGNRLRRWKLTQGSREVGLTFKWKRGAGVYLDTLIAVTFFVRRLSNAEIQEAP